MLTSIAESLIKMADHDLVVRESLLQKNLLSPGYHPEMEQLHRRHSALLDEIIDAIGYPTVIKVGQEANEAAWLIVQHAISEPHFMKKCYNLLSEDPNASPKQLAYLYDRICYFEGRPQKFGTQFDDSGIYPVQNREETIRLREELGLAPYDHEMIITTADSKTNQDDLHDGKEEFNLWRKKVGWIKIKKVEEYELRLIK